MTVSNPLRQLKVSATRAGIPAVETLIGDGINVNVVDEAERRIAALAELGIDLTEITDRLEAEGVAAFAKSFDNLLAAVADRAGELAAA